MGNYTVGDRVYILGEILGELPSGKKLIKLYADGACGLRFYTNDQWLFTRENMIDRYCHPTRMDDLINRADFREHLLRWKNALAISGECGSCAAELLGQVIKALDDHPCAGKN